MEKTFGGHIPDAAYVQAHTLGELAQAVQKHLIESPATDFAADRILPGQYDLTQFPEYVQLKEQEQMLLAVAGNNPYFRVDEGGVGNAAFVDGRQLINFCIYDYIGMSHDRDVVAAAKNAIDRYGTGAGASRLISGEKQIHRELEQSLAAFLNVPAAVVFVSGHATNVTTIGHLFGPEDLILHDNLAHNSIIQGAKLSGATRRAFAHNDWAAMDAVLCESRNRYRRVLIVVEGVYSMDGDFPELPRFVELKKKHKTLMLVDEAHSLGTMGASGRGIGEYWGIDRADVDLWMGTLSKSLASCGGYIAGAAEMVEYLKYTAPGFVYSVGLSPSNAAAALASLTILKQQPQRVELLRELSELFLKLAKEKGLDTGLACGTPVIPVIVGSSVKSLRLSDALFKRGINVQPILYPVVPEQSARLRFFITTNHTKQQIETTINAIADELEAIDKNSGSME
jgi:8-amino-7-oxononanoate synthase